MFNGQMMGSDLSNQKITITQDIVDCGVRKVHEEINVSKYNDYEVFSFSQLVYLLRQNLEPDVYLRIHMIQSFSYDKQFYI